MYFNMIKLCNPLKYAGKNIKCFRMFSSPPLQILPDSLDLDNIKLTNAREKSDKLLHYHEKIKEVCFQGGGEKGKAIHVKKNKKMLPRDRIKSIFDEGSDTLELCLQTGMGLEYGNIPGGSVVCIIGKIHGQYCLASANDGTLKGGTFFPVTVKKSLRAQEVSAMNHLPAIYLVDSGGGFLPLQAEFFPDKLHGGRAFYSQAVDGSKGIPQLALVCGSCTAGGAYVPMMCNDAGIVHSIGSIYLGGPPLVKAATGEEISTEDLGGATLHCKVSGCTDYFASTEEEGFQMVRDVVAMIDISDPPLLPSKKNDPMYDLKDLDGILGLDNIDRPRLQGVIARLVDGSRFREFKHAYGKNLITGYAFIDRIRVGLVANYGPLTYEDGIKGSHFVQLCDQRNLPIIFLQNSGNSDEYWSFMNEMLPEERANILRGRTSMMTAVSCAQVPKVSVNIGGCHGDDNFTMCGPSFSPNFIFCWPGTEISMYPLVKPSPPVDHPISKKYETSEENRSGFLAARAVVDGIITPSETRQLLVQCIRIFEQKKRINCQEKNSPIFRF